MYEVIFHCSKLKLIHFIWEACCMHFLVVFLYRSIGEELPKENHKKKHKKHGDRQNSLEEMETDIVAAVTEGGLMQNHDIDNAVCDQTTEQTEQDKPDLSIHASDSSGYHSDHGKSKKKKRKLCEEETGGAGLAQPKSKKKRERNERMV